MSEEDYIRQGLEKQTIKLCPFCGTYSELISGCNYVTCLCNLGFNNKSEWCWLCQSAKYQPWNKPDGSIIPACNDPTHNSH